MRAPSPLQTGDGPPRLGGAGQNPNWAPPRGPEAILTSRLSPARRSYQCATCTHRIESEKAIFLLNIPGFGGGGGEGSRQGQG